MANPKAESSACRMALIAHDGTCVSVPRAERESVERFAGDSLFLPGLQKFALVWPIDTLPVHVFDETTRVFSSKSAVALSGSRAPSPAESDLDWVLEVRVVSFEVGEFMQTLFGSGQENRNPNPTNQRNVRFPIFRGNLWVTVRTYHKQFPELSVDLETHDADASVGLVSTMLHLISGNNPVANPQEAVAKLYKQSVTEPYEANMRRSRYWKCVRLSNEE